MSEAPWQERFESRIDKTDGCWIWMLKPNVGDLGSGGGYGRFTYDNRTRYAHRIAYELWVGPIPRGYQIDHLCHNRRCVRPEHLEAVTHRENIMRSRSPMILAHLAGTCVKGHPYEGRRCLICQRERNNRYYAEGRRYRRAA